MKICLYSSRTALKSPARYAEDKGQLGFAQQFKESEPVISLLSRDMNKYCLFNRSGSVENDAAVLYSPHSQEQEI